MVWDIGNGIGTENGCGYGAGAGYGSGDGGGHSCCPGKSGTDNGIRERREMENCSELNHCYKVQIVLDKDLAGDWQYAEGIRAVCSKCSEKEVRDV